MTDPNTQAKRRQRWLLLIGGLGLCLLAVVGMFLFDEGQPVVREKPKAVTITPPGTVDDRDAWRAQQAAKEKANETLISELHGQLKSYDEQNKRLAEDIETLKAKQSTQTMDSQNLLDKPLPGAYTQKPNDSANTYSESTVLNAPLNQAQELAKRELEIITFDAANYAESTTGQNLSGHSGKREVIGFPVDESAKKYGEASAQHGYKAEEKNKPIEFIPAGSFVRVAMLNGVDAPTGGQAQSNPLPVAFHVLDVANLANKHRLNIKDCRFIAAAWGDLSSERMMGRTETLTCMINGETVEMPIKGQVIGEDGKAGVRGRLVTKQGQLLANALLAGIASGMGKAFQQAAMVNSTSPLGVTQTIDTNKVGQAALGTGMGNAASALEQYYLKAADKLFPVIETDGGRTVEILITKGAVFHGNSGFKERYGKLVQRSTYQEDRSDADE